MKLSTLLPFLLFCFFANAQEKPAYKLYDQNGKRSDYGTLLKAVGKADVVFFGELHDNPVVHWLQLELTKDLAATKQLILGAEMFEADNQEALNKYLAGDISQKGLDTLARLWPNYKTDYKPLVDLAKEKHFKFIATNIPRRYASMVYKKGLESLQSLPDAEKAWIAPQPIAYDGGLPGYKAMLEMAGGHGGDNLPKAQAVKDATMAWFISKNLVAGTVFIHFNGSYHSDNREGILWYLKRLNPGLKIVTIASAEQADVAVPSKENIGKGDFILIVDEDMAKTH